MSLSTCQWVGKRKGIQMADEELWAKLPMESDLDLHIEVGKLCGEEFVALADFEPSTGHYSDPVLIDSSKLHEVISELTHIEDVLSQTHQGAV